MSRLVFLFYFPSLLCFSGYLPMNQGKQAMDGRVLFLHGIKILKKVYFSENYFF